MLLTTGVMLANIKCATTGAVDPRAAMMDTTTGVLATLGISLASGFAAVYTEKVMKATQKSPHFDRSQYSLAYVQVQLAGMSLIVMGAWALLKDFDAIVERGLWHNVNGVAAVAIFNSAIGGLTVAAVLKFADAVLKVGIRVQLSVHCHTRLSPGARKLTPLLRHRGACLVRATRRRCL